MQTHKRHNYRKRSGFTVALKVLLSLILLSSLSTASLITPHPLLTGLPLPETYSSRPVPSWTPAHYPRLSLKFPFTTTMLPCRLP